MEDSKKATMRQVQNAFAAWKEVNDRANALENAVLQHDAARDPPLPQLEGELQALRIESDRLLTAAQHALLTIKTPRSSNGDSTWG